MYANRYVLSLTTKPVMAFSQNFIFGSNFHILESVCHTPEYLAHRSELCNNVHAEAINKGLNKSTLQLWN